MELGRNSARAGAAQEAFIGGAAASSSRRFLWPAEGQPHVHKMTLAGESTGGDDWGG